MNSIMHQNVYTPNTVLESWPRTDMVATRALVVESGCTARVCEPFCWVPYLPTSLTDRARIRWLTALDGDEPYIDPEREGGVGAAACRELL